jgi:chemotaxis protein methyltransferase CheR
MEISAATFDFVRTLVCDQAGIVLERDKHYLVEARLIPIARRRGFESADALVTHASRTGDAGLKQCVVEAMTTNETTFFRDVEPFEALRQHVVPAILDRRQVTKQLRIWCCAASTGQEPYSLAMLLQEQFPRLAAEAWTVSVFATDLSEEVLDRARQGRYTQLEMNRGLPATYLVKYFEKQGLEWQLKPTVRRIVSFDKLNLVKPWPDVGSFDIVMLRNVMIYFDVPTKQQVLERVRKVLRADGYLFLGSAETTMGIHDGFERETWRRTGFYRPTSAKSAPTPPPSN